jgi:hypothetical protein
VPASPVEAEATGQEFVTVTFSGTPFRVPLDVDTWPLDAIRNSRALTADGKVVVDHVQAAAALQLLLADQWELFLRVAPQRRQIVEATQAFAAGVGFAAAGVNDIVFGAVPRTLWLLDTWPSEVESDLSRFWNLEYPDRWRFHAGRRRLTLRQIHVRLSRPPVDGALALAMNFGKRPHSDTALVVMDLFEAMTGRRHPSRPMPPAERQQRDAQAAAEAKARADHADRMKEREARQQSGLLATALANKRVSERGKAHAQNEA